MIPVDQTEFGPQVGNCFSACVASILEWPVEDVPFFMGVDWWGAFLAWCRGMGIAATFYPPGSVPPMGYSIAGGMSPRHADVMHACVALDGAVVHDPHAGDRRGFRGDAMDYIVLSRVVHYTMTDHITGLVATGTVHV